MLIFKQSNYYFVFFIYIMTDWTASTVLNSNGWLGVAYGNGLYVACSITGTSNRIMTSNNGNNWTLQTSAVNNEWTAITYGDGIFVAVSSTGTGNRVMTSSDAITWTSRLSAADELWMSVVYGNGLFVAVARSGTNNRVMTSPDGINWTSRVSAANSNWFSVTYGSGIFVAVAPFSSVMVSSDGITWSLKSAPSRAWNGVTFGNGLFVAVSYTGTGDRIMTSPNGTTWTLRNSPADNYWRAVTYGNGLFVSVAVNGTNLVMTSNNGINWTLRNTPVGSWFSVIFGNSLFVSVGFGNAMYGVDNSCYLKGSLILTANNTYIPIEDLKKGDLIKTYKHGDIKIHGVGKKMVCNAKTKNLYSLYHNKKNNLTITGGHSLLVDSITKEQEEKQLDLLFNEKIEDKYCLLSCFSEDFELLEPDNKEMEIYHLCLENEDVNFHYGIWANDILSDSCPISRFINKNFQ